MLCGLIKRGKNLCQVMAVNVLGAQSLALCMSTAPSKFRARLPNIGKCTIRNDLGEHCDAPCNHVLLCSGRLAAAVLYSQFAACTVRATQVY